MCVALQPSFQMPGSCGATGLQPRKLTSACCSVLRLALQQRNQGGSGEDFSCGKFNPEAAQSMEIKVGVVCRGGRKGWGWGNGEAKGDGCDTVQGDQCGWHGAEESPGCLLGPQPVSDGGQAKKTARWE